MKQNLLFLLIFLLFSSAALAQVTDGETVLRKQEKDTIIGWKTGGVFSITGSQTALLNWSAGGENAISLNAFFSVFANYKKGKLAWDNSLDVGYGLMKQGIGNETPFLKRMTK